MGNAVIFSSGAVKALKDILKFKSTDQRIITGDSDDPQSVAKTGDQSSLYLRDTTTGVFIKTDSGSSTNWTRLDAGGDFTYQDKSGAYTALANDFIDMDASGAARTVTLPTAVGNAGTRIGVKKTDSSLNKVTVDGATTETIDGATTFDLLQQNDTLILISDGANWLIASYYHDQVFVEASGSTDPTVSNQYANATSISLDPGLYETMGALRMRSTTTAPNDISLAISEFSGNTTTDHVGVENDLLDHIGATTTDSTVCLSRYTLDLTAKTAATTVYLKSKYATVDGGISNLAGYMSARRIR